MFKVEIRMISQLVLEISVREVWVRKVRIVLSDCVPAALKLIIRFEEIYSAKNLDFYTFCRLMFSLDEGVILFSLFITVTVEHPI